MIGRNDACWCGSGKKWKKCHYPDKGAVLEQAQLARRYRKEHDIVIKTDEQIEKMRSAGAITAQILDATCEQAAAGVTTGELNDYAAKLMKEAGVIGAALGYGHPPFPKETCISLNEVICHGIPGDRKLVDGDILNIDIACIKDGYYGDCSKMAIIGKPDAERMRVVQTSYDCLVNAAATMQPGSLVCDIGAAIEDTAHANNCSVVYQFVAHGVGTRFHEGPQISHCRNKLAIPLVPGMTFTIEPMINAGVAHGVISDIDSWTATTEDGKPSAQWEYTFLITDTGYEILTPWTVPDWVKTK